ncbi:TetR/AcrR family transcriptional regulator [Longispora sp. K20-0274]|uniref:TetR/AcrR family transcriptional regulator n=1 Tax=Longispora sp. K20-0274 TaxID=3088255 RepID=UPI003999FD49
MEPGRRRRGPSKGDQRELDILAATRRLAEDKPLRQITIDEIARAAGISRSSFYFYFDSLAAVVTHLMGEIAEEMHRESAEWLDGRGPGAESLRRTMATSARLWRTHGALLRQVMTAPDPEPAFATLRENLISDGVRQASARITRDRAAGLAPPGPPADALARSLLVMKYAVLAGDTAADPEETVDTLVTIVRRAIYGRVDD